MKYIRIFRVLIKLSCTPRLSNIYRLLRNFTMLSALDYVANLKLARSAASVPGVIVECGTWKGGMSAGIAKLLGNKREYFLFDSFEGLPIAESIDGVGAKNWQENTEGALYFDNCKASKEDAATAMDIAKIVGPHLIKGWFEETLHLTKFPDGIAVLRIDADWYKSTYQVLDALFPLVNKDGVIIIDDYYTWEGCAKAVHDYLSKNQRPERISSFEGVCFIRKMCIDSLDEK